MQIIEMKTKLEEKIKALENEKAALIEEVKQLKEVAELSEKATALETEVNKLKEDVKALKEKIPPEIMTSEETTMPWRKETVRKTSEDPCNCEESEEDEPYCP